MTKYEELLNTHTSNYRSRNEALNSQIYSKNNGKFILILYILIVIYPIGAWLSFWGFSGIAMSTIIIITVFLDYSDPNLELFAEDLRLYIIETERDMMSVKVDTDKQINELIALNKELSSKMNIKLNEIVAQKELTKKYAEQLATVLLKKIDKSTETLNTVIAEKTETIKTSTTFHARTLDLDIKANKLELNTLADIKEQLEVVNERNDELYDMYTPLMDYVSNLTDDMEYGKLLSEQIRTFMLKSAEQLEKNEKLTDEIEIMLAYQRNQRN